MNAIKKISILLVVLMCTTAVNANNPFRLGVIGGINFNKEHNLSNSDNLTGFHIGGLVEYNFKNKLFLSASTLLTLKGGKYDMKDYIDEEYIHLKYKKENYYLEIPIHVGYKLTITENISLIGSAGPYFGIGLFGKYKISEGATESYNIYSDDYNKRFDMGIGAKLAVELFQHYQVGVGYNFGLAKIADDSSLKNRNVMLSVAYLF